jgi:hypothetical protein
MLLIGIGITITTFCSFGMHLTGWIEDMISFSLNVVSYLPEIQAYSD